MKATNIVELTKQLYFNKPITKETKDYYVPVYNELIEDLRDDIKYSDSQRLSFYIAGQSGSGKTTAMNFVPDDELEKIYHPLYINYRDLLAFQDADIIDVLLMFAYRITENSKKLSKKFNDRLKKIQKKHHGEYEEIIEKSKGKEFVSGIEADFGLSLKFLQLLNLGTKFYGSYKMDKQIRTVTREFFNFKKIDLLDLVNSIIDDWYEEHGTDKKMLVFFDDFDKLRNAEQIHSIFIDNRDYLERINCMKVISVPIHLAANPNFNNAHTNLKIFNIKLNINPIYKYSIEQQEEIIKENKESLTNIIKKRYKGNLINDENEIIEKAIEYSGGILRQFVQLMYDAAKNARRLKAQIIHIHDLEEAIDAKRKQMSITIIGDEIIDLLAQIMKSNKPVSIDNDLFINALLNVQLTAHPNNDIWYDVNPLIKGTVKNYKSDKLEL